MMGQCDKEIAWGQVATKSKPQSMLASYFRAYMHHQRRSIPSFAVTVNIIVLILHRLLVMVLFKFSSEALAMQSQPFSSLLENRGTCERPSRISVHVRVYVGGLPEVVSSLGCGHGILKGAGVDVHSGGSRGM